MTKLTNDALRQMGFMAASFMSRAKTPQEKSEMFKFGQYIKYIQSQLPAVISAEESRQKAKSRKRKQSASLF